MPAEHELLADELIRAVELLADTFAARSIRYAIVGGLATLMRGRPRFTQEEARTAWLEDAIARLVPPRG
jgi:hypothetical protein